MIELTHNGPVKIQRDTNGIPHITAETESGMYFGQGYAQAMDRGRQILLMRILARGRGSELLESSDEMLEIDKFFRRMNWSGDSSQLVAKLDADTAKLAESFVEGINHYFSTRMPFEFKYLLRVKYELWKVEDCITISRMIGYIGLQQSQAEIERLLVQFVQAGIDRKLLEELFSTTALDKMDEKMIRQIRLGERIVPASLQWNRMIPKVLASNNWVVSGTRTTSGKPILCNDPHLEINRLPNVWQEMVLTFANRSVMGAAMPGVPGILIGRNPDIAWGATYTFMDAVDSWAEECRQGSYKRSQFLRVQWVRFKERREIIKRKKKPDHLEIFYENEHGVLDGNPAEEGVYLATRWASGSGTGPVSLRAIMAMFHVKNVKDGMDTMGQLEMSFNWLLADKNGNIGYQMSGLMPRRHKDWSGLAPMPGWDSSYDWKGFVSHKELPHSYNPKEGYIVTANNDLNALGSVAPINMSMGSYRADRIEKLLKRNDLTVEDMAKIQMDTYSLQAEKFMEIVSPLLPDGNDRAQILRNWNKQYTPDSEGAYIFERFYDALLDEVLGPVMGRQVLDHLRRETGILIDFYSYVDKILLSRKSRWFGDRKREDIYTAAINKALTHEPKAYGSGQKLLLKNILLGGKFPRFLGIDRGPIVLLGNRATPHQGQIYRSGGRDTSFAPSYRMVCNFAEEGLYTSIIGGPSDNPFSRLYANDVDRWLKGELKKVNANPETEA
ncbi:MAG: penicillin acylase family protein [Leptospirales bacterium]|nr:penicillin acylase family protein [Leptospirales bacterium]